MLTLKRYICVKKFLVIIIIIIAEIVDVA